MYLASALMGVEAEQMEQATKGEAKHKRQHKQRDETKMQPDAIERFEELAKSGIVGIEKGSLSESSFFRNKG